MLCFVEVIMVKKIFIQMFVFSVGVFVGIAVYYVAVHFGLLGISDV